MKEQKRLWRNFLKDKGDSMDIKEAIRMLEAKRRLIEKTCKDTIPRKIGVKAVNLTNQNFREGGFNDGGLKPWKRTKRQDDSF